MKGKKPQPNNNKTSLKWETEIEGKKALEKSLLGYTAEFTLQSYNNSTPNS